MRRQVLVTGASSGLGRPITAERDRAGFDVWATVRTEADARGDQQRGHCRTDPWRTPFRP
ncbi:hypothetical protein [Microlunatus sp. GCM10028923]|uniref:hypothetical protein n=1 Tax=Microlunatus sp. GCM10028923 TaxID=3273400 RepID=UPI003611A36E